MARSPVVLALLQQGEAAASAEDTRGLRQIADSLEALGELSAEDRQVLGHLRSMLGGLYAARRQEAEAIAAWDAAVAADPDQVNAAYNAGQAAYTQGDFLGARRRWEAALTRAPDDLDLHRKVVQACFALGDGDAGEAALAALKEAWAKTPQAEGTGLVEVVIDQLRVAGARVMASQTLRPAHQDLWYEITWRVYGADGKVDFSVQLETSAYGREVGTPFLMGLTRGTQHRSVGPGFHARPPYLVAREIAVGHIQRQLES